MSIYRDLIQNPPTLVVKEDAKDIVIDLVSCMCDNKGQMRFKKDQFGEFKCTTGRDAYGNFQIKYSKVELEWTADEGSWNELFGMINTGTSKIARIMSR